MVQVRSRGCGAVGSASRSQREGQGFNSPQLHFRNIQIFNVQFTGHEHSHPLITTIQWRRMTRGCIISMSNLQDIDCGKARFLL